MTASWKLFFMNLESSVIVKTFSVLAAIRTANLSSFGGAIPKVRQTCDVLGLTRLETVTFEKSR